MTYVKPNKVTKKDALIYHRLQSLVRLVLPSISHSVGMENIYGEPSIYEQAEMKTNMISTKVPFL